MSFRDSDHTEDAETFIIKRNRSVNISFFSVRWYTVYTPNKCWWIIDLWVLDVTSPAKPNKHLAATSHFQEIFWLHGVKITLLLASANSFVLFTDDKTKVTLKTKCSLACCMFSRIFQNRKMILWKSQEHYGKLGCGKQNEY